MYLMYVSQIYAMTSASVCGEADCVINMGWLEVWRKRSKCDGRCAMRVHSLAWVRAFTCIVCAQGSPLRRGYRRPGSEDQSLWHMWRQSPVHSPWELNRHLIDRCSGLLGAECGVVAAAVVPWTVWSSYPRTCTRNCHMAMAVTLLP